MKKLFNVRDYMFDVNDVIKLGYYVAEQRCDYDGVTMMNREDIKQLAEEEPEDERLAEALDSMGEYDMAIYCHDGTIKTGSEEDLAPIIVDGIEGGLRSRDVFDLIPRLGLHPEETGDPEMVAGDTILEDDTIAMEIEDSTGYRKEGFTVVSTSQDDEMNGNYYPMGCFHALEEAREFVASEKKNDEKDENIAEGTNIFYIIKNLKIVDVIVY